MKSFRNWPGSASRRYLSSCSRRMFRRKPILWATVSSVSRSGPDSLWSASQNEWNVASTTPSARSPADLSTRARISPAAFFVNVRARMFSPESEESRSSRKRMRSVMTRVLPVPAPAMTRSGPSPCSIARRCAVQLQAGRIGFGFQVKKRGHAFKRVARFETKRKRSGTTLETRLPLRFLAGSHCSVKFGRFLLWNRQRLPVVRCEMLRKKHDLPDVIRIVRDLPVDRLHDGVRLRPNRDGARQIGFCQRFQRREKPLPAFFPLFQEFLARRGRFLEFL